MPKMKAPSSGVTIRMYRQGHGDCFLLAMRRQDGSPFYLLIDCGLWTGSEIAPDRTMDKIVADLAEATGKHLHAVLITHEHMDHVNGFGNDAAGLPFFKDFAVDETWLAWTEDAGDEDANKLRQRFGDTLLALAGAAHRLRLAVTPEASSAYRTVRDLLMFETGARDEAELHEVIDKLRAPALAADEPGAMSNQVRSLKLAIKYMRDKASGGVKFWSPGEQHLPVGEGGPRVYALGPPRDEKLLLSLDPRKGEGFHLDASALGFIAATEHDADPLRPKGRIFDKRFGLPRKELEKPNNDASLAPMLQSAYGRPRSVAEIRSFFADRYGPRKSAVGTGPQEWRQIDEDWLVSAEVVALRLNKEVNNTSLVVAIELPNTKKVLLFTGDAQRGNWISWASLEWMVDGKPVTARDLLGRTVFYKVGHHGSHNATLYGEATSKHANLEWLGTGKYADDFVAVIPANRPWAYGKDPPWSHPLASIEEALIAKARGRVFRSDRDKVPKPATIEDDEWAKFKHRSTDLYFEYTVAD